MLNKVNNYNIKMDDKKLINADTSSQSQPEKSIHHNSQKRAFTVVTTVKPEIDKYNQQLDMQRSDSKKMEATEEEWPSLDQLEAIIRGQNDVNEVQIMELPLKFEQTESSINAVNSEEKNLLDSKLSQLTSNIMKQPSLNELKHTDMNEYEHANRYASIPYIEIEQAAPSRNTNFHTTSWVKIVTALASSILTGVLIGYVLLLAVYGVKVWPISLIGESVTVKTEEDALIDNGATITTTVEQQVETNNHSLDLIEQPSQQEVLPIVIQPEQTFTYTVLQAGVFSKDETKQAMINSLQAKGYPATSFVLQDGKAVVFAGVASSQMSTFQTNHMDNIELYRKSYSLYVPKLSDLPDVEKVMQQWIFNVHDVLQSYMKLSEAQFEQTNVSAIYANSYEVLKERYNEIQNETNQLIQSTQNEKFVNELKWHQEALQATQQLYDDYQLAPQLSTLFKIQQQLLSILSYEAKWFEN